MAIGIVMLEAVQPSFKKAFFTIKDAEKRIIEKRKEMSKLEVKSNADTKICQNKLSEDVLSMFCNKLWRESKNNENFKNAIFKFIKKNQTSEPRIYQEWKRQIMYKLKCWDKNPADKPSNITFFVRDFASSSVKIFNNIAIHFDLNDSNTPCKTNLLLEKLSTALNEGVFVNKYGLKLPRFNETKLELIINSLKKEAKVKLLENKKEFTTKEILYPEIRGRLKREITSYEDKYQEIDNFISPIYEINSISDKLEINKDDPGHIKNFEKMDNMIYGTRALINTHPEIIADNSQVVGSNLFTMLCAMGLMCGAIFWIITLLLNPRSKFFKRNNRPVEISTSKSIVNDEKQHLDDRNKS